MQPRRATKDHEVGNGSNPLEYTGAFPSGGRLFAPSRLRVVLQFFVVLRGPLWFQMQLRVSP